jgi:hypothetical protein
MRHKILLEVGIKPVILHITVVIGWDRIHAVDVLGLLFCNREIFEDSSRHAGQNGISHGCTDAALYEDRVPRRGVSQQILTEFLVLAGYFQF